MPCEDESRDQGDASVRQGTLKTASKPPEARREAWDRLFLTALRRKEPCQHLNLESVASRTVRQYVSVV